MWQKIANGILRYRLFILIGLGLMTVFMGMEARKVELQYEFGKLLPENDSTNLEYVHFRDTYGQDGLVIVIAAEVDDFYTVEKFSKWYEFGNAIKDFTIEDVSKDDGSVLYPIDSVFSEAHLYNIIKNKEDKKFELAPMVSELPQTNQELDSLKNVIHSLPFYKNMVYKDSSNIHLMMIFVNEQIFNSKSRANMVTELHELCETYTPHFGEMRYSGLPFVRSVTMNKVKSELGLFVGLAVLVTALILFFFYRSVKVVLTSLLVVIIGVVWSLGTISLFGYKISILMGLMPPLMIVIGIPNCVYLITKYQQEIIGHGNKAKALLRVIRKVGNATFLTNATTAMGFATFLLTKSDMMRQFGAVAAINILALFFISILVVPIVYSYLKPPKQKHIKHLEKKWLDKVIEGLLNISQHHRTAVYISSATVIGLGIFGMSLMRTSGNIVDDLPKGDAVVQDLKYFEEHFNGVMPFEVLVRSNDTLYKNGNLPNCKNLAKIDSIQSLLLEEDKLSKSISLVDAIKYISQAYGGGEADDYKLRSCDGLVNMMGSSYFKNTFNIDDKDKSSKFLSSFMDSTHTETRITVQIKDVGIDSMEALLTRVKGKIESVLHQESMQLEAALNGDDINADLDVFFEDHPWALSAMEDSLVSTGKAEEFDFLMDANLIKTFYGEEHFQSTLANIVKHEELDYTVTGSGVIYTKGTTYLVGNLFTSLLAAVIVIGILMSLLFRSWRMVLISLVPNILPLVFTSGLMGYMGVPIKPSTILVFSIAFGISVDDTIHFLAKYRQELKLQSWNIKGSVLNAIKETGVSMVYTSIILFFGFSIFIASNFGGTQALGILVSVTLFVAMLSNLILLPTLLLTLEKWATTKAFRDPLLSVVDEEEDIELEKLEIIEE
jgi:predicted RND superfamily exporter protein